VRYRRARWFWDVRGTYPVAVGDGRQPLNVRAQHPFEGPGLSLAQLGELGGDVRNRAVVLAQLHAGAGVLSTGSVSLAGQCHGEGCDPAFATRRTCPDRHRRGNRGFERPRSVGSELGNGGLATGLPQIAQGGRGQVVIGVRESRSSGVGQRISTGRAPAPSAGTRPRVTLGQQVVAHQGVQMAPDGGGRQAQGPRQRRCGLWPSLENEASHGIAGANGTGVRRAGLDFHNISMTYLTAGR